jgi:benzoate membrane transport protein
VAGLALLGVLSQALTQVMTGTLRLGPLVAFVVASSGLSLFGLGAAFWALVFGTAASLVAEPAAWRTAHETASPARTG